jgi:hypothetical protein
VAAFFRTNILQTMIKFGKKFANFILKFGVLIVGEIENNFFCQMLHASDLEKNVW